MDRHEHHDHPEHTIEDLKSVDEFALVADVFKQVGDASRVRIFWILCHFEENVSELAELCGMTAPAVSHHLRQLKQSGLVMSRREGKEVYYKASPDIKAQALHEMIESVMQISCPE